MNWETIIPRIIVVILILALVSWLLARRERRSGWENVPNPPDWIKKEIKLIENRHRVGSSWAVGKAWYLKGDTFRYRLTFEGQGGNYITVARKLRRRKK